MRTKVTFAKPGFFLADTTVEFWIDQRLGYRGGFRDGFEVWATLEPGPHALRTTLALGPITREKRWQLDVPVAGDLLAVTLRYSRFWGNFRSKLVITAT